MSHGVRAARDTDSRPRLALATTEACPLFRERAAQAGQEMSCSGVGLRIVQVALWQSRHAVRARRTRELKPPRLCADAHLGLILGRRSSGCVQTASGGTRHLADACCGPDAATGVAHQGTQTRAREGRPHACWMLWCTRSGFAFTLDGEADYCCELLLIISSD